MSDNKATITLTELGGDQIEASIEFHPPLEVEGITNCPSHSAGMFIMKSLPRLVKDLQEKAAKGQAHPFVSDDEYDESKYAAAKEVFKEALKAFSEAEKEYSGGNGLAYEIGYIAEELGLAVECSES